MRTVLLVLVLVSAGCCVTTKVNVVSPGHPQVSVEVTNRF